MSSGHSLMRKIARQTPLRGVSFTLRSVLCGAFFVLMAPSMNAAAESDERDERARTHFLAGSSYFEEGRYREAGTQFMESYRLSSRPPLLLNAAMAFERAGEFEEAHEALTKYLEHLPEGSDEAPALRARIRNLEERAEEKRRLEAELAEARKAREPERSAPKLGWMGWSGVGAGSAGVASLVASLATGLKASSIHGSLEKVCGPSGQICPVGSQADADRGRRLSRVSTGTLIAGAALAAGGTILLILDLKVKKGEDQSASAWRLDAGPGELGLSLRRDF